ncbi:hypothetical protein OESDEN_16607 [Oesophagostomum dentatum]|uniref:SCP domain-containing protein n=1 Tax=Oesophagostomum dentatum TaxID=61180 RepID=A0A0B1SJL6_OESDE|nr:hypothetical protein OESDEN_16607 [Oesophagostomum dentatum]
MQVKLGHIRMGWGATRQMGCAIGNCTGEYVVVCRYLIRGNTVGSLQYTPGAKCSACPSGTTCTSLGLCN